jgi:hypothetical protein
MVVACVLEWGVDSVIIKFLAPRGRPRPRTLIGSWIRSIGSIGGGLLELYKCYC